ncbi:DNA/RNA polymerase [Phytophthora megakarya]|uniref:DNA/RNA polymerase n=1 Tax=Phytophthora megakarya TaxID=4795 RepID=A0A225WD78_9STRA|nr:DNA/RNA polymerase [Phytophthora megakarya]
MYPDFEQEFRVVTDASQTELVAFDFNVNSRAEVNYSITELECLAVVWSVKRFRPYLYGRTFTIITDHAALKWLMTRSNLAGRLHRWSLTLQEYNFEIVYRPGTTNVVADALSRAPAAVRAAVGGRRRRRDGRAEQTTDVLRTAIEPRSTKARTKSPMERIGTTGNTSGWPVETNHDGRGKDIGDEGGTVEDYSLQLRDEEIMAAQQRSKFTKKLLEAKTYLGQKVEKSGGDNEAGLACGLTINTLDYGIQGYARNGLERTFTRPAYCGSRKVKPREVVPPLRSIHGGDVCDRWALDVAGPFSVANGGDRYVVAAVEYVTRTAVARCV